MLNSRIDLFDQKWLDAIFEGRNKKYGAYDLRRRESGMTIKALIIGAVLFTFLLSLPVIIKQIEARSGNDTITTIDKVVEVIDLPPPEIPEEIFVPPAPPAAEAKTSQDVRQFLTLEVAAETEVLTEVLSQDSLRKVVAGNRNIDASDDGEIVIGKRAVDYDVTETGEGVTGPIGFHSVQVKPEYPGGGEPAFRRWVGQELASSAYNITSTARMEFGFVIEKDGSLSEIEILSDGGNSYLAKEAVKVLQRSKKWSPGVNNGQAVRVKYSIPIVMNPPSM